VTWTLLRHDEPLAVVRLGPGADIPSWATSATLFSVTATATETSLVCAAAGVPHKARHSGPWTAFAVEGPLDHALTGVLHELLTPLAEAQVPVLTLATFDTDWILVPIDAGDRAEEAWRRRGVELRSASSSNQSGGQE
jgi:uncharacterized protein